MFVPAKLTSIVSLQVPAEQDARLIELLPESRQSVGQQLVYAC